MDERRDEQGCKRNEGSAPRAASAHWTRGTTVSSSAQRYRRVHAGSVKSTANFSVDDACIGCGLCEDVCPANAIRMADGRPVWVLPRCFACLGCIRRCPVLAISYGR